MGLVNSTANQFGIARYSIEGKRKQLLTQMMENWTPEPLLLGTSLRAYIDDNVNGDICLSGDTNLSQVVNVISPNGDYRFTYECKEASFQQFVLIEINKKENNKSLKKTLHWSKAFLNATCK